MKKIIENLFLLLIIAIVLAYLPIVIIAIKNFIPLAGSVTFQKIPTTPAIDKIKFLKDLLIIVIFILMLVDMFTNKYSYEKRKIVAYIIFLFIVIFSIGTFSIVMSKVFLMSFVIAGVRIIIFVLVPILFSLIYLDEKLITKLYRLLSFLNIIELVICLWQSYILYKTYKNLNIAVFRIPGTFAASGLLAMYSIAYVLLCFALINLKVKKLNFKIIINILLANFIIILTGTRIAIVLSNLVLFIVLMQCKKKSRPKGQFLDMFMLMWCLPFSYILLKIAEKIANRGDALEAQVQGGRVDVIINYLNSCNLKELLIGKGIGFGTNTFISMEPALSSKLNSNIMDGTVNILITQYGLPLTFVIIALYLYFIGKLIKKYNSNLIFIFTFIFISGALIVIGNILEQYAIGVLFIIMNILILNKKNILGESNE